MFNLYSLRIRDDEDVYGHRLQWKRHTNREIVESEGVMKERPMQPQQEDKTSARPAGVDEMRRHTIQQTALVNSAGHG